jgi:hypothetical protein
MTLTERQPPLGSALPRFTKLEFEASVLQTCNHTWPDKKCNSRDPDPTERTNKVFDHAAAAKQRCRADHIPKSIARVLHGLL